jgi:hypothetical protein
MFFNDFNNFTEKECADHLRYIHVNDRGDFNSSFEDKTKEGQLRTKGSYVSGRREGLFELFYPNGNLKGKGSYHRHLPIGTWEYFYENGKPNRTLLFTDGDTLLMKFTDQQGNVLVDNGAGDFNGSVTGLGISEGIVAKGKIINGKPHGLWTSTVYQSVYCNEEFENGKMISGIFPAPQHNEKYKTRSNLDTFVPRDYLRDLENYRFTACKDDYRTKTTAAPTDYSFDMQVFSTDVRRKIDRVIEDDLKKGNTSDYIIGDQYITIKFAINNEGKPEKLEQITPWGRQYFFSIVNSIKTYAKFLPSQKVMYFHLKLTFPGGQTYSSRFAFSNDMLNRL